MPATAICVGEPMARCGNSNSFIRISATHQCLASRTATIGAPVERLDVGTVLQAAQAVSGEIVLDDLIKTLLRIADRACRCRAGPAHPVPGDEPRIAAEATTGPSQVEVTLCQTAASPAELPESVLHAVIRTRQSVILDDASAQNPFSADEYLCQTHVRSVLCLPLVKQAKLIGVLYLETISHLTCSRPPGSRC